MNDVFGIHNYQNALERAKASYVVYVTLIILVVWSIYAFFIPGYGYENGQWQYTLLQYSAIAPYSIMYLAAFYVLSVLTLLAVRTGNLALGSWGPGIIVYVTSCLPAIIEPGDFTIVSLATTVYLFLALISLFNGTPGVIVGGVIAMMTILLDFPLTDLGELATIGILMLGLTLLFYLFNRFAFLSRSEGAKSATSEKLKLAEISTQITADASRRLPYDQYIRDILQLILDSYPQFYHVQLFVVDKLGLKAELKASTGEVGEKLLKRKHYQSVGGNSVIGQVTATGKPVIAQAGAPNTVHSPNDLLPDTRIEAAFPLIVNDNIIGALDFQSTRRIHFSDDEVLSFQSLTESLALALDNIQQFERAEARIRENQALAAKAQDALKEVERLNRRLTQRVWSEYLQQKTDIKGLDIDFDADEIAVDSSWTASLAEAAQSGQAVKRDGVVAVPLMIRGQVIGAMEFELPSNSPQVDELDLELIAEVGQQFGLAAENARLVDESQRAAQQEMLINQINQRLQTTERIEATLSNAARSLHDTLKARRVAIRLGTPQPMSSENEVSS